MTEFDRSASSTVRDILVALGSELSPRCGKKSELAFLGEALEPGVRVDDLAGRSRVGQGGRIALTLVENHIPGSADPLADTEVVDAVRIAPDVDRGVLAEQSTQVIRRPVLPRIEERRSVRATGQTTVFDRPPAPDALASDTTDEFPAIELADTQIGDELSRAALSADETVADDESPDALGRSPRSVVVRYPRRMRAGLSHRLRIAWGVTGRGEPIHLTPRIPGCLVVPAAESLPRDDLDAEVEFWVTPLVTGALPPASILYRTGGKEVGRTNLDLHVASRRPAVLALATGVVLPWLGALASAWLPTGGGSPFLFRLTEGAGSMLGGVDVLGWILGFLLAAAGVGLLRRSRPIEVEATTVLDRAPGLGRGR